MTPDHPGRPRIGPRREVRLYPDADTYVTDLAARDHGGVWAEAARELINEGIATQKRRAKRQAKEDT